MQELRTKVAQVRWSRRVAGAGWRAVADQAAGRRRRTLVAPTAAADQSPNPLERPSLPPSHRQGEVAANVLKNELEAKAKEAEGAAAALQAQVAALQAQLSAAPSSAEVEAGQGQLQVGAAGVGCC